MFEKEKTLMAARWDRNLNAFLVNWWQMLAKNQTYTSISLSGVTISFKILYVVDFFPNSNSNQDGCSTLYSKMVFECNDVLRHSYIKLFLDLGFG